MILLGIHTPETEGESKIEEVKKALKEAGLTHAVAVDNKLANWKAWSNRFWPAVWLVDKQGFARYRWEGELNWRNSRGQTLMAKKIEELLAEKPDAQAKPR